MAVAFLLDNVFGRVYNGIIDIAEANIVVRNYKCIGRNIFQQFAKIFIRDIIIEQTAI